MQLGIRSGQERELTPYELCLLTSPELQKQQTETLIRINRVLAAAVAAQPLEAQWWRWVR